MADPLSHNPPSPRYDGRDKKSLDDRIIANDPIIPVSCIVAIIGSLAITAILAICITLAATGHFHLLASHIIVFRVVEVGTGSIATCQFLALCVFTAYYCKEKSKEKFDLTIDRILNKQEELFPELDNVSSSTTSTFLEKSEEVGSSEKYTIHIASKWEQTLANTKNLEVAVPNEVKIFNLSGKNDITRSQTGHYKLPHLGNYNNHDSLFPVDGIALAVKLPESQQNFFPDKMQKMVANKEVENYFMVFRNTENKVTDKSRIARQIFMHPAVFQLNESIHHLDAEHGLKQNIKIFFCNPKGLIPHLQKKYTSSPQTVALKIDGITSKTLSVHGNKKQQPHFSPKCAEIVIDPKHSVSSFSMGVTFEQGKKALCFYALVLNNPKEGDGKVLNDALSKDDLYDFLDTLQDGGFSGLVDVINILTPQKHIVKTKDDEQSVRNSGSESSDSSEKKRKRIAKEKEKEDDEQSVRNDGSASSDSEKKRKRIAKGKDKIN